MRWILGLGAAALTGIIFGYFVLSPQNNDSDALSADAKSMIRGLEDDLARSERESAALGRRLDEAERARREAETQARLAREARTAAEAALAQSPTPDAEAPAEGDAAEAATTLNVDEALASFRENPTKVLLDPQKTRELLNALEAAGSEGTQKLLALLSSEESADRIAAAQLLMQLGDPAAIGPLGEAVVNDEDAEAAAWASQALIRLDGDEAVPTLRNALANSPHEAVRVNSLWGLCRHGDAGGYAQTLAFYNDKEMNEGMQRALGHGILQLDSPDAMAVADAVRDREADHPQMMKAVIQYYGRVPGPETTRRLVSLSQDANLSSDLRQLAQSLLQNR